MCSFIYIQEIKKSSVWKSQLEMYKKQVTELHHTLNDETNKIDKLEFETKLLMENLNTLQKEKDVIINNTNYTFIIKLMISIIYIFQRLVIERNSLREANYELKCLQTQMKKSDIVDHSETSTSDELESAIELKFVNIKFFI